MSQKRLLHLLSISSQLSFIPIRIRCTGLFFYPLKSGKCSEQRERGSEVNRHGWCAGVECRGTGKRVAVIPEHRVLVMRDSRPLSAI